MFIRSPMLLRFDASAQTDQEEIAAMPGPESFRLVRRDDDARGDRDRARDEGRLVRRGDDARDDSGRARHGSLVLWGGRHYRRIP